MHHVYLQFWGYMHLMWGKSQFGAMQTFKPREAWKMEYWFIHELGLISDLQVIKGKNFFSVLDLLWLPLCWYCVFISNFWFSCFASLQGSGFKYSHGLENLNFASLGCLKTLFWYLMDFFGYQSLLALFFFPDSALKFYWGLPYISVARSFCDPGLKSRASLISAGSKQKKLMCYWLSDIMGWTLIYWSLKKKKS